MDQKAIDMRSIISFRPAWIGMLSRRIVIDSPIMIEVESFCLSLLGS